MGQDESRFWSLTLREISVILAGTSARLRREQSDRMSLAWHTAALQRAKKMPQLEELLQEEKKPTGRQMTPEQIEAITRSWLASRHRKRNGKRGHRRSEGQPRD